MIKVWILSLPYKFTDSFFKLKKVAAIYGKQTIGVDKLHKLHQK